MIMTSYVSQDVGFSSNNPNTFLHFGLRMRERLDVASRNRVHVATSTDLSSVTFFNCLDLRYLPRQQTCQGRRRCFELRSRDRCPRSTVACLRVQIKTHVGNRESTHRDTADRQSACVAPFLLSIPS